MENATIYCKKFVFPNNSNIYGEDNNFVIDPLLGPTGPAGSGGFAPEIVTGVGTINGTSATTLLSGTNHILENGSTSIIKTIYNNNNNSYYTLGSGVNIGGVNTLYYDNPRNYLYAGGTFTTAGGVFATNIAMWQPGNTGGVGTWYSLGSGLSGGTPSCNALTYDNTKNYLYAGGTFTTAGSVSAANISMWQAGNTGEAGAWYSLGSGLSSNCNSLAYDSTRNYLYTGGIFTTAGGTGASRIAMWQAGNTGGTGTWYSLGSGLNSTCNSLAYDSTRNYLYVGGTFTTAGGVGVTGLALWVSGNTGGTGTWYNISSGIYRNIGTTAIDVRALTLDASGNLYVGGVFGGVGNIISKNIIKWTPGGVTGTGTFTALGKGLNSTVNSLMYDNDTNRLYIGGIFNSDYNNFLDRICYFDGSKFNPIGRGAGVNVSSIIKTNSSTLYVGSSIISTSANVPTGVSSIDISGLNSVGNTGLVNYGNFLSPMNYSSATGYSMLVSEGNNWYTGLRKF
jgi:hypothetical protein